jgi:hypothetical protein
MKLKDLKPNKRRYKRPNFMAGEFLIIRYVGKEWIMAENEAGKEVILVRDGVNDDTWDFFDQEILYPDEPAKKGLL